MLRKAGLLVVLGAALVFVAPRPAHADPHAVFYTAIGQQQLFFNFLAALDQADYVEPATGNFSREELAKKRDTADQTSSVNEALKATKTDLAAVVNRLVTLDGTDLWTNYVALQIAKEAAQATDTSAYVELLCAQGLGRLFNGPDDFCENKAPVGKAAVEQKRAFVVSPSERTGLAYQNGLDSVFSDKDTNSDYQTYLKYLEDPDTRTNDIAPDYPVPLDESVATLRKKAEGNDAEKHVEQQTIARLSQAATSFYRPPHVDDNIFSLLKPTSDGDMDVDVSNISGGTDKINLYMAAVQGLTNLPQQFINVANKGAATAEQHLTATNAEGSLAQVRSQPVVDPESGAILGHTVDIASPPYGNKEQVAAGLIALGTANAAPQGVPPIADTVPGTQPILPDVAGAQDDQRTGRVLHATTPSTEGDFEPRPVSLDLSTNPTAVHEETGGKHFLLALTDGSSDRSGCGCGVDSILNDLGQAILGKINGWRL